MVRTRWKHSREYFCFGWDVKSYFWIWLRSPIDENTLLSEAAEAAKWIFKNTQQTIGNRWHWQLVACFFDTMRYWTKTNVILSNPYQIVCEIKKKQIGKSYDQSHNFNVWVNVPKEFSPTIWTINNYQLKNQHLWALPSKKLSTTIKSYQYYHQNKSALPSRHISITINACHQDLSALPSRHVSTAKRYFSTTIKTYQHYHQCMSSRPLTSTINTCKHCHQDLSALSSRHLKVFHLLSWKSRIASVTLSAQGDPFWSPTP